MELEIMVDSNAALGVVHRKGAGKLRHVRVGMLWVQGLEDEGGAKFKKVGGESNPADLMTKAVNGTTLERHCQSLQVEERSGRAASSNRVAENVKSLKRRRCAEAAKRAAARHVGRVTLRDSLTFCKGSGDTPPVTGTAGCGEHGRPWRRRSVRHSSPSPLLRPYRGPAL